MPKFSPTWITPKSIRIVSVELERMLAVLASIQNDMAVNEIPGFGVPYNWKNLNNKIDSLSVSVSRFSGLHDLARREGFPSYEEYQKRFPDMEVPIANDLRPAHRGPEYKVHREKVADNEPSPAKKTPAKKSPAKSRTKKSSRKKSS